MDTVSDYRAKFYTPSFKWGIRIGLPIYAFACTIAYPSFSTLEVVCNLGIIISMLIFWFDIDLALPIKRNLIDAYDFKFQITRKVMPRYITTTNFSAARDRHYRSQLHTYTEGHYVYVLKDASASGYYKIGRTNNPSRRIGRFEVALPIEIHVVFLIPCENEVALESVLHNRFRMQRVRGEWFTLTASDIEWFMVTYGMEFM